MDSITGAITVFAVLLPRLQFDYTNPLALGTIVLGTGGLALALVAIVRSRRLVDQPESGSARARHFYSQPGVASSNRTVVEDAKRV